MSGRPALSGRLIWLAVALVAPAKVANATDVPARFTLASPAFEDNAMLPLKYAGGAQCRVSGRGGDVSPPLVWSNPPAGTKSFAVVMTDADGRRGLGSVHWVAYGIPSARTHLDEAEGGPRPASDVVEGKNSRGTTGYTGPCGGPPTDAAHHYIVELVALELAPDALPAGLDREHLWQAIEGHSLGPASLVVRYRPEP